MKAAVINTDHHTYLVRFKLQSTNGQFIVQGAGLVEVLKRHDQNGVRDIKIFDPVKCTFNQVSKNKILCLFTWEWEVYEYLKGHYYFK